MKIFFAVSKVIVVFMIIFAKPVLTLSSECAGTGQGTVTLSNISPGPSFQSFEKGKWVSFSGAVSYSLVNADSGRVLIALWPYPSDIDGITRPVTIKRIDLTQSNGTVNFDGEVQIDRSIKDGTTPFYFFSISAILYHPAYSCTSIIYDTGNYQVSGDNNSCDLKDVINILHILNGMSPFCYRSYDFDRNEKIDMADGIGILQCIATIR